MVLITPKKNNHITNQLRKTYTSQLGMTETNTNFYEVFGAILCGRCVCGDSSWLSEGEVYKRLPDCDLKTLIDDITTWLTENKDRIDEVFSEYNTMKKNREYRATDAFTYVNDYDPNDQRHMGKLSSLVEEFREQLPILVRVRDGYETCHLICMLDHLRIN